MVCIADASPLLKQWSYRQQQRLKSGADSKTGLQSRTVNIQLKSPRSGGRGRKLSLSDPIETIVDNLVLGATQQHIECKALDKALKAGHTANPSVFYHEDLIDFAQAWRDVYNVDITKEVCIGKLHAIEITGEQSSPQIPQVCVGFNKLTGVCPTYTTKFCAEWRTEGASSSTSAAILAANVIDDETNEVYDDLYSLRLIEGGGTTTESRKYYATTAPTGGGKIAAGCPGLAMGLEYNSAAASSADPGLAYVDLSVEPKIYEEDTDYFLIDGQPNSNVGLPKVYDQTGDPLGCSGDFEDNGDGGCFKVLNGANAAASGVLSNGIPASSTSGKVAGQPLADIDTCPGLGRPRQSSSGPQGSAATPTCSISDFIELANEEHGVNSAGGNCIRRIYTDLCTSYTEGHNHQLTGSDNSNGEATYTKPLKISLAHGDYCDGVDAGKIGACSLSRKLEQDFVFELSCEQLASQMVSSGTQDGGQKGVEGVRNVDVSWSITNPSNTTLLVQGEYESDANYALRQIKADFHCTGDETSGLCSVGKIPARHPCKGLIRDGCANPDYVADEVQPYYTSTPTGEGGAAEDCIPSTAAYDAKLVEAWKKAVGLEGTFRTTPASLISEIYSEAACVPLRDDVNVDGADAIFQKCKSLEADLAKIRIDYATAYLLHDAQAIKKDRLINFEKHINAYKTALIQTCDANFGDISTLGDTDIKALKSSPTSLGLEAQLIAAATTPEDVAINKQRKNLDQRIRELEDSIAYIREAHDNAGIAGVDVAPTIAKFEKIVKHILGRLAAAYGDSAAAGLLPMATQAACPHLADELVSLAADDYQHTSVGSVTADDSSLPVELNHGQQVTLTNLVRILEHTLSQVTLENQDGTDQERTVDLKAGLQQLVVETAEYCLWESQDRYDRCETCAARQQMYEDLNVYRQVSAKIATLQGYESEQVNLKSASCLAPVYEQLSIKQIDDGSGNLVDLTVDTYDPWIHGHPVCTTTQSASDRCVNTDDSEDALSGPNLDFSSDGFCDDPSSPFYADYQGVACPGEDICDCAFNIQAHLTRGRRPSNRMSRPKLGAIANDVYNPAQIDGGVGNQARRDACSIPAQGVLSSLAGIDGSASYIRGYPNTGFDDASTLEVVETNQPHPHYASNSGGSSGGILYDKTTFENHLSACIDEISLADTRGCPAQTSGSQAQTELELSSTQKNNLEAKAVGDSSDFEVKRAHCISALDVVLADTSLAYDCALSDPSNTDCVDGAITHFVKQCEKTDGSAYSPHASPHNGEHDIGPNGPGIFQAVRAYARAEDAYDAAKKARETTEGALNIDPSELKNLKDDVHAATTYRDVIAKHIESLQSELTAFKNRHATVVTKCEALVEAKVRAKVEHAVELKKYDFEVADLDVKKAAVNGKTYDSAKTALDEYCAQVSAVKDAVTIASLADVNSIVRAGERCNTYDSAPECCQPDTRTADQQDSTHADYIPYSTSQDCTDAEAALAAADLCTQTDATQKAQCIQNILDAGVGSGSDGECIHLRANGDECSQDDECSSGICRDVNVDGETSSSKECGAFRYALSGDDCDETVLCMPFGSHRQTTTHSAPTGQAVNAATGRWTQDCNSAGKCSDLELGDLNQECATAVNVYGQVGDTCNAGLTCDLFSVFARGAEYDSVNSVNTVDKDVCIPAPECDDDIQNGQETGIDCGSAVCVHTNECVAEGLDTETGYTHVLVGKEVDEACTFHSDCASGATCTQQYVYELANGDSCDHTVITDGTCLQIPNGKVCKNPYCTGLTPVPNILFGELVQCDGSSTDTDPYAHTEELHTFTVNGITFKYYVVTGTEEEDPGARRRLLSRPTGTYDFAQYGRKFRSAPMPNQHDRAEWLQSVKANVLKSHKLQAASDLDGCRGARDSEKYLVDAYDGSYELDGNGDKIPNPAYGDQAEFATHLDCLVNDDCTSGSCVNNRCAEGNSAYSVSGLPDIDVLNVCDSDGIPGNGYAHTAGSYTDGVLDKYGYSVGDNLKLAARQGAWRRHRNRKLRETTQRNKLSAFHQKLGAVNDPSGGFLLPQADNLRDCNHESLNFCSFSYAAHINTVGFCSNDCSDCKAGQCEPCATTMTCEMCGVQAEIPAEKEDPNCNDLWGGSYLSAQACLNADELPDLCIKTHECVMTTAIPASAGYKCLTAADVEAGKTIANGDESSCVENTVVRKVDATCLNPGESGNDCEDKSARPSDAYGTHIIGQCEKPVSAQTCHQSNNCGLGVACNSNPECYGEMVCESNKCAAPTAASCNYAAGKSIDDMDIDEIKAAFVTGTTAENVAADSTAETTAVQNEQACSCASLQKTLEDPLLDANDRLGNDQAVIDQMNNRIAELQALIADGTSGSATEGPAHKAIGEAEEALRLYLTNTASGAASIVTLTTTENTKESERDTARAAALQVAAPAYLDYYRDVVSNSAFSEGMAREDAYALYAHLAQGAPACLSDGSNAVACQSLAGDVVGEDDEYLDELHRIFAACQSASNEMASMAIANEAAGIAKSTAATAAVVDSAGVALDIDDCVAKSTDEFNKKKLYDDKKAQIDTIKAEIETAGYVPAGDIVKKHKHYSCCSEYLDALEDLERCATNTDCSAGGNCIGHFCVPEPCLCASGHDTHSVSYNTHDFPINDDDCNIAAFSAFCGDGTCDSGEDFTSCPQDCRCGNGVCDDSYYGEMDASTPPGSRTIGENCVNCVADCPAKGTDGSFNNYDLEGVSTQCPAIHADDVCGCYPDENSVEDDYSTYNCENAIDHPDDCSCKNLCVNFEEGNIYLPSSGLTDATSSYTCPTVSDCAAQNQVDEATLANVDAFCRGLNDKFDVTADNVAWGSILQCGSAATDGQPEVTCPEQAYSTAEVPIVPGGALDKKYRCPPVLAGYLLYCTPDPTTGEVPGLPTQVAAALREKQDGQHSGLVPNCDSITYHGAVSSMSMVASMARWSEIRALEGNSPLPACEVGVTKVDPSCQDWSLTLGCPAECSCPAAVQPTYDSTNAVNKGDVIVDTVDGNAVPRNEVIAQPCDMVCECPQIGVVGDDDYAASFIAGGTSQDADGVFSPTATGCLSEDSNPDVDCAAITQASMTLPEYQAVVGACYLGNDVRVHRFKCTAPNGGTEIPQTGCVPVDYKHKEIAHDGSSDECYGSNGYDAAVVDSVDTPAAGCRDADGVLTGLDCYYGDGTNCEVGDAIAKANTVVLPVSTNTPAGHAQADGSYAGGNQQCDAGETADSTAPSCSDPTRDPSLDCYCPTDCFCGDNVCGVDAKGATEVGACDVDCVFHCKDNSNGGCYNFAVNDFGTDGIGQWNPSKGHDNSFTSFESYCAGWAGNGGTSTAGRGSCPTASAPTASAPATSTYPWCADAQSDFDAGACHQVGGNGSPGININDGFCDDPLSPFIDTDIAFTIEGANGACQDICDCGSLANGWSPTGDGSGGFDTYLQSSRGSHKMKKRHRKLLGIGDKLKEWTKTRVEGVSEYASKSFKSLVDKVNRRRKLLAYDSKPTDRADVPWLVRGSTSFDDQEALCLASQQSSIDTAILNAFEDILGTYGLNAVDATSATGGEIDAAIEYDDSKDGIALLQGAAITSLNAELARKQSEVGDCTASEKAIVHAYAQSWVPVEHCYPLKFLDAHGDMDTSASCVVMAGQALSSVAAEALPGVVEGGSDAYKLAVRKGFLSLVQDFKYLTFTDETDITSQCTNKGSTFCSAASAQQRTGGSCLTTEGSSFPARQSCVDEYKKNLADIVLWFDTGASGFTGSSPTTDNNDNVILDVFHTTHVAVMGADTENALNKLKALRALVGDADDAAVTISDANSLGTIQGCWEAYENRVGYADELTWLTASGALAQAVNAVKKEEEAIIQVHADAKAECKEHCVIDEARDQWSTLVARCNNDPSSCKCRRETEDIDAAVKCNCMFDNVDLSDLTGTSMQNYNGVGEEDCQVNPSQYIAAVAPYSTSQQTALVYAGESPTALAEGELSALITDREVEIDTYVNLLVANLGSNLAQNGLLGQQSATSIQAVCQIMNQDGGQQDSLQLADDHARDNFFGNYMNAIQTGSVESSDARRLASEPCSLCD